MSKFNSKVIPARAISYEGSMQYAKNPLEDWMNFLFSSYLSDKYYENSNEQMRRFLDLTDYIAQEYGNEFVAKASFFARNELGLRSISQLTAAYLNDKQFESKRNYYRNFYHRPDDVAEVFAAIDMLGNKRSHALVRGSADYLSGLNEYSIGKYKMNGKDYNMYDLINITHATSTAINDYKAGLLKSPDTWEVNISTSKSKDEKSKNWCQLVEHGHLGYLALIRNLRNIVDAAIDQEKGYGWLADFLSKQITDRKAIKQSLVFPYQIYTAYKAFKEANNINCIIQALETAFIMSIDNVPNLDGISCIMLDVSGSMESNISSNSNITIKEVGACYAAMLLLKNIDTVVIKFGTNAKLFLSTTKYIFSPFTLIEKLCDNDNCGYGTNIGPAFELLAKYSKIDETEKIKRIFLISDMQVMNDSMSEYDYREYCHQFGRTKLYSFDLGHYSSQVANPNNPDVFLATSLSEKIFTFINLLEDGQNLYDYINENYSYKSYKSKVA